jgi:ribonuclease HI
MIEIYVDGCRKKSGHGGWAAIIMLDKPVLLGGFSSATTNNLMELSGPLNALRYLKENGDNIKITSDSEYFVRGFNSWMHGWARRSWRRKEGEVKNLSMWQELYELNRGPLFSIPKEIKAEWVRGHNGHRENELCDKFANFLCAIKMDGEFRKTFDSLDELESFVNSQNKLEHVEK